MKTTKMSCGRVLVDAWVDEASWSSPSPSLRPGLEDIQGISRCVSDGRSSISAGTLPSTSWGLLEMASQRGKLAHGGESCSVDAALDLAATHVKVNEAVAVAQAERWEWS